MTHRPDIHEQRGQGRTIAWLILGLLAARVLYLVFLCPYELVGDEAHYWEWSRRPALSYATKGPGVALSILASRSVFGSSEWSVRLPAAAFAAVSMLAAAGLARRISGGDNRAGLFAAALFALTPVYTGVAQLMTIDSPFLAFWALAAWAGWAVFDNTPDRPRRALAACAALGAALGIGFMYKYNILLLLPGFVLYWIIAARKRGMSLGRFLGLCTLVGAVALLTISPVLVWNHLNDWQTVKHVLGHLGVEGGDIDASDKTGYDPMWTLELVGAQVGFIGPPLLALMGLAVARAWRDRKRAGPAPAAPGGAAYLLCCGLPIIAFFLAVTAMTDAEGNWPIPGYVTLLMLAAVYLPGELDRYRQRVADWLAKPEPRPRAGWMRAKPETAWQVAWHWSLGWGIGAMVVLMFGGYALQWPGAQRLPGVDRIGGHAARAAEVHDAAKQVEAQTASQPFIVADHYQKASLLAFYLPGRPRVYCAASRMGKRINPYDYFEDVNLADPNLLGRDAVLADASRSQWHGALGFDRIRSIDGATDVFAAYSYAGPRVEATGAGH